MNFRRSLWLLTMASLWLLVTSHAGAHCDTMDGPVIKDAQAALAATDVTRVLKWIQPQHEQDIKTLFQQVLIVRSQGEQAKILAEQYFFESLVRIHRAGEGAPYTGLKPAGQVEPIIAASDQALGEKDVDGLIDKLTTHMTHEIRRRFQEAVETQKHLGHSVEAGRAYVRAYVEFTHYVEGLHTALVGTSHAHGQSTSQVSPHNPK